MYDPARFQRLCARHTLTRGDLLLIGLFLAGHPHVSHVHALREFICGRGPAAIAAGRA